MRSPRNQDADRELLSIKGCRACISVGVRVLGYFRGLCLHASEAFVKQRVQYIGDKIMAGSVWGWSYFVNRTANGRLTVSCALKSDEPAFYRPGTVVALKTGADVYRHLKSLTLLIRE
jgi:hypothetical protein